MSEKIRVTYLDGRVETVSVTPMARVACERHFKGIKSEIALEGSYWMPWWLLKRSGKEEDSFDAWLEKIDDTEEVDDDDDELDPTRGATTTDGTSDTEKPTASSPSPLPLESPSES